MAGGPRSAAGKAVAKMNGLAHGLRADTPVIAGEDASVWEAHREGILRDLAPVGAIEEALAQRVALLLWRLARVARFETLNIASWQERIDNDIADAWRFS